MLELRILGTLDLRGADGQQFDEALRKSKRMALLAFLAAARPSGFHRRDKVAALFWPELDKERARGALRTTLSRLRDDLGEDVVDSRGNEEIAIRRDRLRSDIAELHDALVRDDAVAALDLYRGPILDGVHVPGTAEEFEQWMSDERTAIKTGLLAAVARQVDQFAEREQWRDATVLAQRACVVAPDDESAARRLIRVALGAGDRGAALRAYEDIERVLQREYDVRPSDETTALIAPLRGAGNGSDESGMAPKSTGHASGPRTEKRTASTSARVESDPSGRRPWTGWMMATLATIIVVVATWNVARIGMSPSESSARPAGSWRQIVLSTGRPPASFHGRATIDSSSNGLLAMGGATLIAGRQTLVPIGDALWRLIGLHGGAAAQWARVPIAPGPAPRPRWQFGAAYESATDRWFVHGGALGESAPCSNDTWVLDRASGLSGPPSWRAIRTRGELPPPRSGIDLAMDWNRRTMTVFGGNDCVNTYFHDVWVLTFDDSTFATGSWAHIHPDSSEGQPVTRNGYAAAYDTASARLFVYGGSTPQGGGVRELWILDHADGVSGTPRWHLQTCAGDAPPIHTPSSAYNSATDTWTFFGGADPAGDIRRELWRLEGLMRDQRACRWIRTAFTEPWPLPRSSGSAATLTGDRGFLIFGGYVAQFSLADTWIFTDSTRR